MVLDSDGDTTITHPQRDVPPVVEIMRQAARRSFDMRSIMAEAGRARIPGNSGDMGQCRQRARAEIMLGSRHRRAETMLGSARSKHWSEVLIRAAYSRLVIDMQPRSRMLSVRSYCFLIFFFPPRGHQRRPPVIPGKRRGPLPTRWVGARRRAVFDPTSAASRVSTALPRAMASDSAAGCRCTFYPRLMQGRVGLEISRTPGPGAQRQRLYHRRHQVRRVIGASRILARRAHGSSVGGGKRALCG